MDAGWHFWIDRGGTFTDVVARDPEGRIRVHKLLSEHPERYDDAPLFAIRTLLGVGSEAPVPSERIASIKMGTTLATNALLERKGARIGLLVTKGFGDLLEIGYQDRPDIFALDIVKPETLAARTIEINERILADGAVRTDLDEAEVRAGLESLRGDGIDSVAVLFLHSFAYPVHELRAGAIARELGFAQISLSHEVAGEIKAVSRGDTTSVDAYLTPILRAYIARVRDAVGKAPLRFMQSHGGLTDADHFTGKNAVLSGPAGGVVAYAHVCERAGFNRAIGFDMGGTSTDVSRYDGRYERVFETRVAGVRLKAPMMAITTVAAGGGSILTFDGRKFAVGPESAGARPGPACYRNGGPATVTDANLVLGRIQPRFFPSVFGPRGDQPIGHDAAWKRIEEIRKAVREATGSSRPVEEVAAGFVRIANENMAEAIKEISVARGYNVQEYALCSFGGAGAQHACAIAQSLGIRTVLLHPHAGVLSAYGMGLADAIHDRVHAVLEPLSEATLAGLAFPFEELESETAALLRNEGFVDERIEHERSLDLRYEGTDAFLNVVVESPAGVKETFEAQHRALYGFVRPDHPIEIVNLRVESRGVTDKPEEPETPLMEEPPDESLVQDTVLVHFEWPRRGLVATPTPVYLREDLKPGHWVDGPALIIEPVSTIVVDPGWQLRVNSRNHLELTRQSRGARERLDTECDPVLLEVFNNLFMSVATQMGEMLERVSHSANMKERLDFSCAVFSPEGELVANAPHIPVHLGAMGESVRAVLEECGRAMQPGDVYVTNDPYHGGSHLPDITVVQPVFNSEGALSFLVANRGHHADIGGVAPGSMPPFSKHIDEEGVILHNFLLVHDGKMYEREFVEALTMARYPARNIPERLSDIGAQLAANAAGERLIRTLNGRYGEEVVRAYMRHVRDNAAAAMRDRIRELPDGTFTAEDRLDGGARIRCTITIDGDRARVDFTGTDPQVEGNLNAPPAVVVAAVLYCFRTLTARPVPLNAGCLAPIEIVIPEGSLLKPRHPAAVVGGNVETSMRVVDVIYQALGVLACGQGTMNNLTFGTQDWAYYETICGGAGAGNGFDGASAVHTHMTNTRITDPEVLERRHPVVLREFSVRRGSGGDGIFRGGDGAVRELEFLGEASCGILSERRTTAPRGMNGAGDGAPGRNILIRDGKAEDLESHARIDVAPGDILRIETPGGGGFNPPA